MFKLKPVCVSYLWILRNLHLHHAFQMHYNFASICQIGGGGGGGGGVSHEEHGCHAYKW